MKSRSKPANERPPPANGAAADDQPRSDAWQQREARILDAATTLLLRWGYRKTTIEDVARVCAGLKRVRPFIIAADWRPTAETDRIDLRQRIAPQPRQMSLF